ncbi:cation transporter [Lacticaseibacillus casei]|jgi:divalent metal cation (Fe/Co/Zn/Cd) transporter|uniref:Cation transporter n=1 Tax=Lacticaseibacillus huelsenbergensis TaxID=3035291 RepID=A0ABY8DUV9_9LACO|nr:MULTISPECIES: cation transporter [Lacticaseibacillus]MDG3061445.1 cation transporter [Lacticaseibacillus sp. BCRC 81376]QVI37010.1 cation transporter [Lacticaseibacillus casei]QXG58801.1 cation transporter [Lacticaseibacillus casei]WFB39757.1 cation transporter [Lacticaseibacillus huelsenbergensis]WFB41456.1 cation transporter [Lacticaseibacillus huelsenbergensis]
MQPLSITAKRDMTAAIRVEYFSTAWMAFEFIIGFWSGLQAGSILLIAFGLDSFLEIISGATLIWRLKKENSGAPAAVVAEAERRSSLVVGSVLLLLSLYVVGVSGFNLVTHAAAESSFSGIGIAIASVLLMPILTLKKRHLGQKLASAALVEDGMCNITCAYMAATVLLGSLLTWLLNWWWADSVAALILVYFVASEGWESLQTGLDRD